MKDKQVFKFIFAFSDHFATDHLNDQWFLLLISDRIPLRSDTGA
jgi:hypothetical protein